MLRVEGPIAAIVTDIEGTTSSMAFVHHVLFPFARARLAAFISTHAVEPAVRQALDAAKREAGEPAMSDGDVVTVLLDWIDEDRKATSLKALQGMIWDEGYRGGHFQGHIYDDAAAALRRWHAAGKSLYVYSSGSVAAQRQIFGHTAHGDLTPLFSGHFDTTTGPKKESDSYRKIAAAIARAPETILFLSDSPDEIVAARAAGLRTVQLRRVGEAQPPAGGPSASSFAEIELA